MTKTIGIAGAVALGIIANVQAADLSRDPSWKGRELEAWRPNGQIRDLVVRDGALVGTITGSDSQLTVNLDKPFVPHGNQRFRFRLRLTSWGKAQLYWTGLGDSGPSERRQCSFSLTGDGAWHDYEVKPGWCVSAPVRSLRFDFPNDASGMTFELADMRVESVGQDDDVLMDAEKIRGVSFSLQMPKGIHYGQLSWAGEAGAGSFGFSTATDGLRHDYWLDFRERPSRHATSWKGLVGQFEVKQPFADKSLPVENLQFLDRRPDTPPDPVMTSALPSEALPRAGRPLPSAARP